MSHVHRFSPRGRKLHCSSWVVFASGVGVSGKHHTTQALHFKKNRRKELCERFITSLGCDDVTICLASSLSLSLSLSRLLFPCSSSGVMEFDAMTHRCWRWVFLSSLGDILASIFLSPRFALMTAICLVQEHRCRFGFGDKLQSLFRQQREQVEAELSVEGGDSANI